jgi:tetratricopeptide (TPR) repeat protein
VVLARLKNPAIGLRVIRPSLQPETADLIARMLEADPFMRYPTYASLLADIREALRVAKQEKRSVHHKVKKSRAGPLIVIGIGVLACLVLVIGALQASRSSKKNKQAETEIIQPEEPVDSEEVAAATEPEVHATPELPETVSPVVEPFTRNGAKILMAAANFMNEGKTMASEEQLQVLYDHMRPRTMGRYWVRMLQAMGCWNDGRSRDARVYLREIMEAPFETEDPDQSHPGDYLHAAARHLTGSEDEGKLYIEAARWAPWYKDFAELIVGINYLNRGKTGQAETHLQHYVNSTPQGKQWPYSLQPLARTLLEQQADWRNISEQIEVAIEKRKSREALETLEEFRDRSSVIFAPLINAKRQRVEVEIQRRMEEQRRAEMLAHIKQVQQDLDMLDEVRTQNLPFLAQRDYRKAAAATSRMLPRMETPEGQDSMRVLQDSYERLNDYKRFIIDAVNRSPFEGSSELGGTAVKANLTGIKVSLYGHGAMLKPWDQISTRLMVQMGHRYIKEQDMSSEEQADMMLSLALLCYYSSAFNPAEKYAEEAINMNPSIKVTVRRFMPDVVPN